MSAVREEKEFGWASPGLLAPLRSGDNFNLPASGLARFSYDRGSFPGRWSVLERWRARKEWKFFAVLPQADGGLAVAWWSVLLLRGVLPALFSLAMGFLVAAVQRRHSLTPSFT